MAQPQTGLFLNLISPTSKKSQGHLFFKSVDLRAHLCFLADIRNCFLYEEYFVEGIAVFFTLIDARAIRFVAEPSS